MKKVLIIPSWYPHPSGKTGFFFQEQAELIQNDYDIRVLFVTQKKVSKRKNLFKFVFHFLFHKLYIQRILLPKKNVYLNPPLFLYELQYFLNHDNFNYLLKSYDRVFSSFLLDNWRPDLIHAHSVKFGGVISFLLSEKYKIPYIVTEHNFFCLYSFDNKFKSLVKNTFENANALLTVSKDKSKQILSYGINANPIPVWNLVDEDKFELQPVYCNTNPIKIISLTAASYIKDNFTLLAILNELKKRQIPYFAKIIGLKSWGNDNIRKDIVSYIQINNLENYIDLIDYVERDEIHNEFVGQNVFILTSIAEGMPVSVLEAMSSGLYVVATKHGGTEDIIDNQLYGSIIDLKDFKAGADVIEKIYKGEIKYNPKIIRDRVISICGKESFFERISKIYDNII